MHTMFRPSSTSSSSSPIIYLVLTSKYAAYSILPPDTPAVVVDLCCEYSKNIVTRLLRSPKYSHIVLITPYYFHTTLASKSNLPLNIVQFSDFESIEWERVLSSQDIASSYIVRKGLSRKAQFSLQLKKYSCKRPSSILHAAIPYTIILDVWAAYEDMKIDFGGGTFASFDMSVMGNTPLHTRLENLLYDVKEELLHPSRADWMWILKPSVVNKGIGISILQNWDTLIDRLGESSDIREWVLQKYLDKPLLINGYKFHIRTYILCIGALKVYVYNRMLLLLAGNQYNLQETDDLSGHLTNTARAIEVDGFDEEKFVRIDDDLVNELMVHRGICMQEAEMLRENIKQSICNITSEVFAAYESEYTSFCPLQNCFELFGLDFMVDNDLSVYLLEVNPGPDYKQSGDRLCGVISGLMEGALDAAVLGRDELVDFRLAYDKVWSTAGMQSGLTLH